MTFQELILALEKLLGGARVPRSFSRTTPRSARGRSTRTRSCAPSVPSPGTSRTSSRARDGPPTADTATTRTGCSSSISYQVILKPAPLDIQQLYIDSLLALGTDPNRARHPVRRGRLGVADARRVGPRLAGLARRARDQPVHLLPAGRRRRLQADQRRAHLRARAHRDVPAGRRRRLRLEYADGHVKLRRVFKRAEWEWSTYNFEARRRGPPALTALRQIREGGDCRRLIGVEREEGKGGALLYEGDERGSAEAARAARL